MTTKEAIAVVKGFREVVAKSPSGGSGAELRDALDILLELAEKEEKK